MGKMASISLTIGAAKNDRVLTDAGELLRRYRDDTGCDYLDYQPVTPMDTVLPEDLAVTLLVNSQVGWRAFRSLMDHGKTIDLMKLPAKSLQDTSPGERDQIATLVAQVAQLPGFAASVATKVLHKKRPALIPLLDNQAIFGAYMNPLWPAQKASTESIKSQALVRAALDWITFDLNRPENRAAWSSLLAIEPQRTQIQLFDSVWWMYFRSRQPVR
jgi:hypothetical protein